MTTQLAQRVLDLRAVHDAASRTAEAVDADGSLARGLRILERMVEEDATMVAIQQLIGERLDALHADDASPRVRPENLRRWAMAQVRDPEVRLRALERAGF